MYLEKSGVIRGRYSLIASFITVAALLIGSFSAITPHAIAKNQHPVYNSNRYVNSSYLDSFGTIPFTTVYDMWNMSCSDTSCSHIPTESAFTAAVATSVKQFRSSTYIAMDFENMVISVAKTPKQAQLQANQLKIFTQWVRKAYPNAKIGEYDYDWNIKYADPIYSAIRAQLYTQNGYDMFNPVMYQFYTTQAEWDVQLTRAIAHDKAIAFFKPIVAYASPYKKGITALGALPDTEWRHELTTLDESINGQIVWTQCTTTDVLNTTQPWVQTLKNFMS